MNPAVQQMNGAVGQFCQSFIVSNDDESLSQPFP